MIQFNLLPDIKIQYLRANRQKHTFVLVSVVVILASIAALVSLFIIVFGLQKKSISDLSSDITVASKELQSTPQLNDMLTVQNQLVALPQLHDQKPVVTRLYGYLEQATPEKAVNSRTLVDFVQHTLSVSGTADSLETINVFIDRLKATTYHTESEPEIEKKAYSEVTLSSFGRDSSTATFTINLKFDELIFSEADEVVLSFTQQPTAETEQ